jgi:uncharacterized membrane protein HdeD (DUF308 family)
MRRAGLLIHTPARESRATIVHSAAHDSLIIFERVYALETEELVIDVFARNWGWVALRGVIAILFGLLTIFRPGISLGALIVLFGVFALVDGLFRIVSAVANRHNEARWGTLVLGGALGVAVGLFTFAMPGMTAIALLYVIAFWAIFTGAAEIAVAIRLRKVITGEWMLVIAGVASVLFGVFLVARPAAGALAVALWIGCYALVVGVMLLVLAFRLRHWSHDHTPHSVR